MRLFAVATVLVVVCLHMSSTNCSESNNTGDLIEQQTGGGFLSKLPKVFDFGRFKTTFKKYYKNRLEELARQKLYWARAFEAFISAVKFKCGMIASYLGVNRRSDWTPDEVRRPFLKIAKFKFNKTPLDPSTTTGPTVIPSASIEDIKTEFTEIESHKDEPVYAQISAELEDRQSSRRKRDTSGEERDSPPIDELLWPVNVEEPIEENSTKRIRLKSNNPVYLAPELMNSQSYNRRKAVQMPAKQAGTILGSPGLTFLKQVVTSAASYLFDQPEQQQEQQQTADLPKWAFNLTVVHNQQNHNNSKTKHGIDRSRKRRKSRGKNLPDQMFHDWRQTGCFGPTKDQEQCGACYIFAALSLFEWLLCSNHNRTVDFSEQYVIDCGTRMKLEGCEGGDHDDVFDFVGRFGFELSANYPFLGKDDQCRYDPTLPDERMGFLRLDNNQHGMKRVEIEDFEQVLDLSPIIVSLLVPRNFTFYRGGIETAQCELDADGCGHSMLLVGDGIENGQEYWLLRNSFGDDFGELGYYKLSKDADCWIDDAYYGRISEASFKNLQNNNSQAVQSIQSIRSV